MRGVNWFLSFLPNGLAFRLFPGTNFRKLFQAIGESADQVETETGNVLFDIFPQTTRSLEEWESQFGIIPTSGSSEQDRRDRVEAEWRAQGGQSPGYTQGVLQAAGFDLFVHEWWIIEPGPVSIECGINGPVCTPVACSGWAVECGDGVSEAGGIIEDSIRTQRNPATFVGGWLDELDDGTECGDGSEMGRQGQLLRNVLTDDPADIPADTDKHQFFWYVGGENFPDITSVPLERRSELLNTLQKIRPRHTWIVLLVNFG